MTVLKAIGIGGAATAGLGVLMIIMLLPIIIGASPVFVFTYFGCFLWLVFSVSVYFSKGEIE